MLRDRFICAAMAMTILICPFSNAFAQTPNPDVESGKYLAETISRQRKTKDNSAAIEALIKKMTVEEKVGQMTQLTIDMVTSGDDQDVRPDAEKIETAINKYGVGSILNVNNQALPIERWHEIISAIQTAAAKTRLKIPVIYGIDSIHGANYVQGSTLFPQQLGMAATWDPALIQKSAEIAAMETRAAGIPWSFSPVLDVGRNPQWPRLWETFGEDPYLVTVMGAAFVRGLEGEDLTSGKHVASSLKHYVGYGLPITGRDRTPALIPEYHLREYFLPPFAAAVKAGSRSVMVNSGDVNGVPGHINKYLLTDVLKNELGFDGFIVSDWEDIKKLVNHWRVAETEKEATKMAVLAGLDMSMVPLSFSFSDNLIELINEKEIPMERIDDAVRRILRVKFELGLFDQSMPDAALLKNFGRPAYKTLALDAARQSITLLKNNEKLLPLTANKKVLVTGPTADSMISLNNGWTYVWQGSEPSLYPKGPTIKDAVEKKVGKENFRYVQGTRIVSKPNSPSNSNPTDIDKEENIAEATRAANESDVIILCLGEGSYTEGPGSIADLTLPDEQLKLAKAMIDSGKPIVLVLAQGRPRIISSIADSIPAIMMAYNPGNFGGTAIADVLFGDHNPGGKLPITYPRSAGYFSTYDMNKFERGLDDLKAKSFSPQFEFGTGLSYTTFSYSEIALSSTILTAQKPIDLSVNVKNDGDRAGSEAVIMYVRDDVATMTPPAKRVRRFAKVFLQAGQSKTINFTLNVEDLKFVNSQNKRVAEPGVFTISIGGRSAQINLR